MIYIQLTEVWVGFRKLEDGIKDPNKSWIEFFIIKNKKRYLKMKKLFLTIIIAVILSAASAFAACDYYIDSCQELTEYGEYCLSSDIDTSTAGTCINITHNLVTLKCLTHTISFTGTPATGDNGVYSNGFDEISIEDCDIDNFHRGIYLIDVQDSYTISNHITNSANAGLRMESCVNNDIVFNSIENDYAGIVLEGENTDNTFTSNLVTGNDAVGIYVWQSSNNDFVSNNISDNDAGAGAVFVESLAENNTFHSNIVNDNGGTGFEVSGSDYTNITDNEINRNWWGISLGDSGAVINNTISDSDVYGVLSSTHGGNDIHSNIITGSGTYGIYITESFAVDANLIYNNYLNNTNNADDSGTNSWNAALTSGTNIIGGDLIGGNYYTTPSGNGSSEVCIDDDENGICDTAYSIPGGTNTDNYPLTEVFAGATLPCGSTITEDTVLGDDILNCDGTYALRISSSDITLDCAGHNITSGGSGSYGVYIPLSVYTNIEIKNCTIDGFSNSGIYFGNYYGGKNSVINSTIINNYHGIDIPANDSYIAENTFDSNNQGIYLSGGNNTFVNNTIKNSDISGIYIFGSDSDDNTFLNNQILYTNSYGVNIANSLATGNNFTDTVVCYSGTYDFRDPNMLALTSNTVCDTSNPTGICDSPCPFEVTQPTWPSGYGLYDLAGNPIGSTYEGGTVQIRKEGEIIVEFDIVADADLSSLTVDSDLYNTVVDFDTSTGVSSTHSLYAAIDNDYGAYYCPNAVTLSEVTDTCTGIVSFTHQECVDETPKSGVICSIEGSYYKLSGLTTSAVAAYPYEYTGGETPIPEFSETNIVAAILVILIGGMLYIHYKKKS